jgi:hypothetical protein
MMDVPVDNRDTLAPLGQQRSSDSDIVEQTKTHRLVGNCVMAGRATRSESNIAFARAKRVDPVKHSTDRPACCGPRPRCHVRVAVDHSTAPLGDALDQRHMFDRVRRSDLGSSCQTWHSKLDSIDQPSFGDACQRRIESCRALGMPSGSAVHIELG